MTTDFDSKGEGDTFSIRVRGGGWFICQTPGTQSFESGYARRTCGAFVYAHAMYTLYSSGRAKLSETAAVSSRQLLSADIVVDHREGSRVGVAIVNDTDLERTCDLRLADSSGSTIVTGRVMVPARSTEVRFVDELITVPADVVGLLSIRTQSLSHISAVGLRFTGSVFAALPPGTDSFTSIIFPRIAR